MLKPSSPSPRGTTPSPLQPRVTKRAQAGSGPLFLIGVLCIIALSAVALTLMTSRPEGPVVHTSGEPNVGGPFTMVDHRGQAVTNEDFSDRIMILYFGFTFCPDVCPTQLLTISDALDALGDKANAFAPILVTVDPERDTPDVLAQYIENFHPAFTGLTGTDDQLKAMTEAYYVTYYKVEDSDTSADYLVDHTSIVYVMGRDGKYLTHFTHATTPEDMAKALEGLL